MVTHRRTLLLSVAAFFALVAACDKVPLLAPTGSAISLFLSTNSASLNSEVTIVATVIENGQDAGGSGSGAGTRGAGTPVQNGTVITFTTTIGTIEPAEARTHNGQVTVKFLTGATSGSAVITAYSGGASKQGTLKVGAAAVTKLSVTTTPQLLGASGGNAQVVATATDDGGTGVGGVPVTFSTDKGSISPSTVTTDSSGVAATVLTTTATSVVTARVGAVTPVTATVQVSARSLISFSTTNSSASAGVPISFTVAPAAANISNVHIDFGDGDSKDLGVITTNTTVPHPYNSPGNYTATASVAGEPGLSTPVIIGSLSVSLTSSASPTVNAPVTFTATLGASPQIDHFTWAFDDGTGPFTTSGASLVHVFTSRGLKNIRVDVFGVGGGKIGTAPLIINVQ